MVEAVPFTLAERLVGATAAQSQRLATLALRERPGVEAAVDARRLLMLTLGCEPVALVREPERELTADEARRYAALIDRRLAGEPVSRIAGRRSFYGRDFVVTPATLDPRPESETLVEAALKAVANAFPHGEGLDILDIGTGTGCLLLTLLAELPRAKGVGVDVSASALEVARENGHRLGLDGRARWVEGRGLAGLRQPFSLIVSNPPYIASGDIGRLDDEVKNFDPRTALNGGVDGLDIYREIASELRHLPGHAQVYLEVGHGQAGDVATIMRATLGEIEEVAFHLDMAGMQRCVAMRIQN